jgi:predicted protein tyrosine phosphatase
MPTVNFVSRQIAEAFMPGTGGFRHLISIADPDVSPELRPGWQGVLPLRFHDLNAKESYASKRPYAVYPDESACQQIIAFACDCLDRGENVLVHCEAGVSRSAAAALALEALGFELWNRQRANFANVYMLELFSNLLGVRLQAPACQTKGGIVLPWGD